MTDAPHATAVAPGWTPGRPFLVAMLLLAAWIALLALPMLGGQWIANDWSDQVGAGWAFRSWSAAQLRETGHVPQWNPMIFGGLPFVGAMHGDIFYPMSFLRLALSAQAVLNITFVLHYLLAGAATYALLRRLGLAWSAAVTGGMAYMLSGVMGSYPSPGHDGKLVVSALLPVMLIGLHLAVREGRRIGYPVVALVAALGLLAPHAQMHYYLLVAAGLFTLGLAFTGPARATAARLAPVALAAIAVAVGLAASAIQIWPFLRYLPFSPRATGIGGFDRATSYAIPWDHVPELVFAGFNGHADSYWGSNPLKLHSEYLGFGVVALAVLGLAGARRRLGDLAWWLLGIGVLFLLIALGGSTPFYRLWYEVMPFVKQTRAPGMALYVVALVVACFAALGVDRIERGEGKGGLLVAMGLAGGGLLLAISGGVIGLAEGFGAAIQGTLGRPAMDIIRDHRGAIIAGAAASSLAALLIAGAGMLRLRGAVPPVAFALALPLLVGGDLWLEARQFWKFRPIASPLYAGDAITARVTAGSVPARVFDLDQVYPQSVLMGYGIPQLLGYHGNELHRFDELMGGKNEWRNAVNPVLWDLYAVEYLVLQSGARQLDSIPGYTRVLSAVPTASGKSADLWQRAQPSRWARVVPMALKAPDSVAVQVVAGTRAFQDQVVVVDSSANAPAEAKGALPPASASRARVTSWAPGRMVITLDPAPPAPAWLLVAENWYPDWRATVDGRPARVQRGDMALLAVELPAGAREAVLRFDSDDYATGRAVTLAALGVILAGFGAAAAADRKARARA
ncbi:MAG: hypothetical protein NW201_01145 [Gemmatimonadales bacterium]|nr:hypothetical protein [Gemmatimonadales bacterium]